MSRIASSFFAGLLFGIGLVLAGMTDPTKVFGFLNITAAWDPSLALVMGGGLLVYGVGYPLVRDWKQPLLAENFLVPEGSEITRNLAIGAALFGAGWAIAGFCPGPVIVALGAGMDAALTFVPAMFVGMFLYRVTPGRDAAQADARQSGAGVDA